ncbi:MAG: dephospho-CoA kinase [Magnetococcales bacterium]|nr:dephospho-CoA kinase [Magnetococcales bacterium]
MVSLLTAAGGGRLFLVAVTGSLGCGKSRVSRWLAAQGAHLLDADQDARQVLQPGTPGWQAVVERFGTSVLQPAAHPAPIDRRRLGEIVFADAEARHALEAVVHPRIYQRQAEQLQQWQQQTPAGQSALVVAEVPLLFEAAIAFRFDRTIAVICGAQQWERLRQRSTMSTEVQQAVIAQQLPEEEKQRRAWHSIDNRGNWQETESQLIQLWEQLRQEAARSLSAVWPTAWPEHPAAVAGDEKID